MQQPITDRPATKPKRDRPKKLRGHREGSVWWREDRKRWVAEVELPDGRTRTKQFKRKGDADKATAWLRATASAEIDPRIRLGPFLRLWIDRTETTVSEKTANGYRGIIENHLAESAIGNMRIGEVEVPHIDAYFRSKESPSDPAKLALDARTINHHRAVLRTAYNDAARWNVVPLGYNPAAAAKPPRVPRRPRPYFTLAQVRAIIDDPEPDRLHAMWVLAPLSGMRESELGGLTWTDIDPLLDEHPAEATVRLKYKIAHRKGEWVRLELKTGDVRDIELAPSALEALLRHREAQLTERATAGLTEPYDGLIFVSEDGLPMYSWDILDRWYATLARLGLPKLGLHDGGRHTFNTLLMQQGIDWRVAGDLSGHSTAAMQAHYSHVNPAARREAVNRLQAALKKPSPDHSPDQHVGEGPGGAFDDRESGGDGGIRTHA